MPLDKGDDMSKKYKMTISRMTVDKLGVKLYDRVSAVIAEQVANCYDADATKVHITAPMGEMLATKKDGVVEDKGFCIEVKDNGIGMTPDEVNAFYLIVGAERRKDAKRGNISKGLGRKVMGRKGVGKLAPFGVCKKVEIITSGGERVKGKDENGRVIKGYLTAHLTLDRSKILKDTDKEYNPDVGELDGIVRKKRGTTLKLKIFDRRRVPKIESFERQLSQRFGLQSTSWNVTLLDSQKARTDPNYSRIVGEFSIAKMDGTEIRFKEILDAKGKKHEPPKYITSDSSGKRIKDIEPGFTFEETFYPITGWVGYSQKPYKDDLMAGIRIYCRNKIAAQTKIFNMKAGFTGEYDIRSYLVGELYADWLDEDEDLIRTDRQDILWSHELGQEFEKWGQTLVKKVGSMTREPTRKKAWKTFEEVSDIRNRVLLAFPTDLQKEIRENTIDIAKAIARTSREDEFADLKNVEAIVDLSFMLGPHITLDHKLNEVASSSGDPLSAITMILKTARIAELAGFGKIADDRIRVIKKIETLKDEPGTLESAFQSLITEAPWLINPEWSPVTANQSFNTLKSEFQKYYKQKTGTDLILGDFSDPDKQPDFVLATQDNTIQIIEIKKPDHKLINDEMVRINNYIEIMRNFLAEPGNEQFVKLFPNFHVTLVCDRINLKGVHKTAFGGLKRDGTLSHMTWRVFLLKTRKMHEDFLNEAEKQRINAAKK